MSTETNFSKYSIIFESNCEAWHDVEKWNEMYLKHVCQYFNDLLKVRGYVFLSEIYTYLGIPVTKTSLVVGWRLGGTNSDNIIEFNVVKLNDDGGSTKYCIDFNVDGDILSTFD